MENYLEFNNEEDLVISSMIESFRNTEISYKIRKINLLKNAGLPIPETSCFKKGDIFELRDEVLKRIQGGSQNLVIRPACIPDKVSMLVFHININNIDQVLEQIESLCQQDSSISDLILREAIGVGDAKEKIVGRLTFEDSKMLPVEQILEIYKGSETTGILNKVNPKDPNFYLFIKSAGKFMKPAEQINEIGSISPNEIKELYRILDSYKDQMDIIRRVFSQANKKRKEEATLGIEFSFYKDRIFFNDID
jgi:hypothetical protein